MGKPYSLDIREGIAPTLLRANRPVPQGGCSVSAQPRRCDWQRSIVNTARRCPSRKAALPVSSANSLGTGIFCRKSCRLNRQPRMRTEPHRLVFIDETAVKTNLTRLRGRAPVGERLYGTAPFSKWGTQTFIAGLTQNALIAPWVINAAMNGPAFDTYIETQLVTALDPGTVVILDNVSTHKSPRAAQALKERGCCFLFLPAYSPDLNPIEMAFSKL